MLTDKDHLLFIAPTAYPLGGVAVWLDYLLKGFVNHTEANVTFGAVSGTYHSLDAYLEHYPFDNVQRISCGTGSVYSRVRSIASTIARVKPTVVVSVNIPDVYLTTRFLRHKGQGDYTLVSTIHGVLPRLFADLKEYDDVVDHVVVTNQLTRLMVMATTGYAESQIHYAPYGVEEPQLIESTEHNISKDPHSELKILYCGRIDTDQKRCQDLIEITQCLIDDKAEFELLIAGDGLYKPELLSQLEGIARKDDRVGSDSRSKVIRDLGALRADQVSEQAYLQADVLLLTSDWETGPIVIWEAMAHGLCVVTSGYIGLRAEGALEHDANCLIFDVGDTDSAAILLQQVATVKRRQRLISNGRELVQARYTKEKSIDAWITVFQGVCRAEPLIDHLGGELTRQPRMEPKPFSIALSGRLERVFGPVFTDRLRSILGLKAVMNSAGDEWPHAHSRVSIDEENEFQRVLRAIENS